MKRLQILILIFLLALSIPLGYFLFRTFRSLEQEEAEELRYFAETLFDEMGRELALLVRQEENRAVDAYGEVLLSIHPRKPYIAGYLQNNPDGSMQVPRLYAETDRENEAREVLGRINEVFNRKRTSLPRSMEIPPPVTVAKKEKGSKHQGFADRYLDLSSRSREGKAYLGQQKSRVDRITAEQALNLQVAQQGQKSDQLIGGGGWEDADAKERTSSGSVQPSPGSPGEEGAVSETGAAPGGASYQVEVDPLQSVLVDSAHAFVFRRIMLDNQIFRQGFVIDIEDFMNGLVTAHFTGQPMARFTHLHLAVQDGGRNVAELDAGSPVKRPSRFSLNRTFPRPFDFLHATLVCEQIPPAPGRRVLMLMAGLLAAIMFLGLLAIYRSSRAMMELSERRAGFVSSVTHELKTPLANVRMYIEMLEQGMAGDPERESEYFRVLGSESSRLTRLIDNVLEFSRLERKQRVAVMREGTFADVIREVRDIMDPRLREAGFAFSEETGLSGPFMYDRELMIQVLVNLMENSVKFGKDAPVREIALRVFQEDGEVKIRLSDTGPGIPRAALKKVFDDFYRVENTLTRSAGGTGIGLALVKKSVRAMGGTVSASNNKGPGCTITIRLPSGG